MMAEMLINVAIAAWHLEVSTKTEKKRALKRYSQVGNANYPTTKEDRNNKSGRG